MNTEYKRYIWLTLFLIWAILFVYFLFWPKINKSNLVKTNTTIENKTGNLIKQDVLVNNDVDEEFLSSWDEEISNIDKDFVKNDLLVQKNEENTWSKIPDTLVIWNITLELSTDNTYDDIFDILWFLDTPKYKVNWKKIYIKKIDSIDYEEEKINIEQLIQKIWGNIAEVNWFWDKQLFVNLDPYYKKESISLVEYNWNLYVMVLPYNKYYEYEKVIKEFLFDK